MFVYNGESLSDDYCPEGYAFIEAIEETHHTICAAEILEFSTMQYETYLTVAIH